MFHQYTLRVPPGKRAAIQKALEEAGISTQIYYPIPNHALVDVRAGRARRCPATDAAAASVLSLPIYPELSDADVAEIARKLRAALG